MISFVELLLLGGVFANYVYLWRIHVEIREIRNAVDRERGVQP